MNRHQIDATSLISGLVFAGVALVYLIAENTTLDVDVRWALPLALIGLGIGGVVGAVTSARRANEGDDEPVLQSE
jgi:uncharacterized membrane protein YfcA